MTDYAGGSIAATASRARRLIVPGSAGDEQRAVEIAHQPLRNRGPLGENGKRVLEPLDQRDECPAVSTYRGVLDLHRAHPDKHRCAFDLAEHQPQTARQRLAIAVPDKPSGA